MCVSWGRGGGESHLGCVPTKVVKKKCSCVSGRVFIKGWTLGKLTSCEDDFAGLV